MKDDGPFTDEMVRHGLLTVQTQHGIIRYMEGVARVLAEAGRASHKATGDAPEYAVRRWSDIVRNRALEILREEKCSPQKDVKKLASKPS